MKYIIVLSTFNLLPAKLRAITIDILLFIAFFVWVFLAYKYSDWKNWRIYYPTILFWALGDTIYNVLFCDNPLWKYKDPLLNHTLSEFFTIIFVFSSATLLFLNHYPKNILRQLMYITMWVSVFSGIEFIFYNLGSVLYYNSWNIGWSVVHNTYQFILLRLHHSKPLLAWIMAFIVLIIIMNIFGIPLKY